MHRSTWLGFFFVLVGGCSSGAAPDSASVPLDPYPDARGFFENIKNYPYVAPTERSTRIALGSEKLRVCMTKSEVRSLLGAPDYSEVNYGPKGPMPRWLGYAWTYYQSIKADVANTHDPHIEIFFDKAGHVIWAAPQAMQGVREIGSPRFVCTSGL
jgi:hypothetical protein